MMKDVIDLIGTSGETPAYAEKKPIPRAEFFAAGQHSIRPVAMFVVHSFEYADQLRLRYDSKVYSVYRVYPKGEITELYCEVRAGVN